ncbi:MAG: hypothetical protein ACE5PT_05490 [Gemmatimonadales bacterium]
MLRATIGIHTFEYDHERFFRQLGVDGVGLEDQLRAYAAMKSFSVSARIPPWHHSTVRPYAVGYIRRGPSGRPFVMLYCHPPTIAIAEGEIRVAEHYHRPA